MSPTIRVLEHPQESGAGLRVFGRAMVGLAGINALDPDQVLEPGRFLGAFDGDQIVGGADSYTSWLVVPGGARVPHAAVTHIGVLPTHTRRGIVSGLVAAQFADFAQRGEVVATLRASEATIYGRFGYAVASSAASIEVTRARAALLPGVADPGAVQLIDTGETPQTASAIYGDAQWVGAIARPAGWWNLRNAQRAKSTAPGYLVTFSEDGATTGYARYQAADPDHWFGGDRREIIVDDLVAHTDDAYLALIRHLLGLDLVDFVTFSSRPVDDPLPLLFADRRAAKINSVHDETWLRLIDVEAALSARSYRDGPPVKISVTDPVIAVNSATFEVGPDEVRRTDAAPDLLVDITGLGAAYLGGTTFAELSFAGRATETTPGALAGGDLLFGTIREPYSGTVF